MWDFLLGIFLIFCLCFILIKQKEENFITFLKKSNILSPLQLSQIKNAEKQFKIDWLYKQKIISISQKKALLKKLEKTPLSFSKNNLKKHIFWGGITCILSGIITLIAANWQVFSPELKLSVYFVLFALLTFCFTLSDQKPKLKEMLLWLNVGWIFAGMALISQIFHLIGSTWDTIFYGALLSTPFICVSRFKYSISLWSIIYGLGLIYGSTPEWAFIWILAVFPVIIYFKNKKFSSLVWILSLIISLLNTLWFNQLVKAFIDLFMPLAGAWIFLSLLFGIVCVIRYFIGSCAFSKILQKVFYVICFCTLLSVDYTYSIQEVFSSPDKILNSVWGIFILAVLPFSATGLFLKHKKATYLIWMISLILAFGYTFITAQTAGLILSLIVFAVAALFFANTQQTKSFYACLILIAFRLWLQYFIFTVSLTAAGTGLIGIGILLIAGMQILSKSNRKGLK